MRVVGRKTMSVNEDDRKTKDSNFFSSCPEYMELESSSLFSAGFVNYNFFLNREGAFSDTFL